MKEMKKQMCPYCKKFQYAMRICMNPVGKTKQVGVEKQSKGHKNKAERPRKH